MTTPIPDNSGNAHALDAILTGRGSAHYVNPFDPTGALGLNQTPGSNPLQKPQQSADAAGQPTAEQRQALAVMGLVPGPNGAVGDPATVVRPSPSNLGGVGPLMLHMVPDSSFATQTVDDGHGGTLAANVFQAPGATPFVASKTVHEDHGDGTTVNMDFTGDNHLIGFAVGQGGVTQTFKPEFDSHGDVIPNHYASGDPDNNLQTKITVTVGDDGVPHFGEPTVSALHTAPSPSWLDRWTNSVKDQMTTGFLEMTPSAVAMAPGADMTMHTPAYFNEFRDDFIGGLKMAYQLTVAPYVDVAHFLTGPLVAGLTSIPAAIAPDNAAAQRIAIDGQHYNASKPSTTDAAIDAVAILPWDRVAVGVFRGIKGLADVAHTPAIGDVTLRQLSQAADQFPGLAGFGDALRTAGAEDALNDATRGLHLPLSGRDPAHPSWSRPVTPDSLDPGGPRPPADDPSDSFRIRQTGGQFTYYRPANFEVWDEWAEKFYEWSRNDDHDVADITRNLARQRRFDGSVGYSEAEIEQIKNHLMRDEHLVNDYDDDGVVRGVVRERFDASPDIAMAWMRLREGHPLPQDLTLLNHELAESTYVREHPDATYADAHAHSNSLYPWEFDVPSRSGMWLGKTPRTGNGTSGIFQPSSGQSDRGGVSIRRFGGQAGPFSDLREEWAGDHPQWWEAGRARRRSDQTSPLPFEIGRYLAGQGSYPVVGQAGTEPAASLTDSALQSVVSNMNAMAVLASRLVAPAGRLIPNDNRRGTQKDQSMTLNVSIPRPLGMTKDQQEYTKMLTYGANLMR